MATTGAPLWLDRFVDPSPIRREGAFHSYAVRHAQTREPRVVIVGAPDADPLAVSETLDRVARAHRAVRHPRIPDVDERGRVGEVEFISLRSSGVVDYESVWTLHTKQSGDRVPYSVLLGLGAEILDAFITAHRTIDPETDEPFAVGILSPANILLSEDGRASMLGLGAYTANATVDGRPANPLHVFVAPEVAAGGRPSPTGDVYAFLALIRSFLPYVASPPAMDRVLRGAPEPDDMELAGKLSEAQMRALAPTAIARFKNLEAFSKAYDEVWALAGIQPDAVGFRAFVMDIIPRITHAGAIQTTTNGSVGAVSAGRYRVERRLGRGGSGSVFLAWDRELKQRVALKLLKAEKRDELQERFLREVRILREVRHPHLVRGFDLLVEDDTLGAVLEYVPGLELDEHLTAHPEQRAHLAESLAAVAEGLDALHERGVVHRDVKPSNIVVHKARGPVLVDFGVAAEVDSERPLTRTGEMVGTPLYMAPEQLRGDRVGPGADVYALAVVLLEGAAAAHPFPTADVPRALELRAAVPALDVLPERLRGITARALDPDPERRPTAAELAVAWRGERRRAPRGEAAPVVEPSAGLVMTTDGRAYRLDGGELVNLQRRKAVRLILLALAEKRLAAPGEAIDLDALQEIGWPGEKLLPEAGANRAYVALSTIRKMGFKDALVSRDDGYLFDPGFEVRLVDELS